MKHTTPEKMGISSTSIKRYLETLAKADLSTHDVIIARGGNVVFEKYWEPFDESFLHRMYSVTKSFVSIAIGFLEQEGKISLDDPIVKYFPEETKKLKDENMKKQTIRHMLMMSTSKYLTSWFADKCSDRVSHYFETHAGPSHPTGAVFEYDSEGSFVMGALVERLTGMTLMEYLREKCLDKIGFSKEAYMLKCPGGHSWSDSALLCTGMDLMRAAQFMLNGGSWDGEQLLNKEYVTAATSMQVNFGEVSYRPKYEAGYGYQFWMSYGNAFWFNGMGSQIALCIPEKDIILVVNSDDQGNPMSKGVIVDKFFEIVVAEAKDTEIEECGAKELAAYCDTLKLCVAQGEVKSDFSEKINGVTFELGDNPMGISKFRLDFNDKGGVLSYTNQQGDKEIFFGMGENVFFPFPQRGYSDEVGAFPGERLYDCAVSAAWTMEKQLFVKVQIIDTYMGRLNIRFAFDDDLNVILDMHKVAEDFLQEYHGRATGRPMK